MCGKFNTIYKMENKRLKLPAGIQTFVLAFMALLLSCHPSVDGDKPLFADIVMPDTVFSSKTDSLEYILNNFQLTDYEIIDLYEVLSWSFHREDFNKTRKYAFEGLELARKHNKVNSETILLNNLANGYMNVEKYDSAKIAIEKGIALALKHQFRKDEAVLYSTMGNLCIRKSDYEKALDYMLKSLAIHSELKDLRRVTSTTVNISSVYQMYQSQKAEPYLLEAKAVAEENGYTDLLGYIYANLSQLYLAEERYEEGYKYAELALETDRKNQNFLGEIVGLTSVAGFYQDYFKDYDKALEYTYESLRMAEEAGFTLYIKSAHRVLCGIYYAMGKDSEVLKHAQQALEGVDSTDYDTQLIANQYFMRAYINLGKKEEAQACFDQVIAIMFKNTHEQLTKNLTELEVKYETAKKENEIETQKNIITRQNMQRWLLVGGVTLCVVILALLWYMLRLRNRRNFALTERNEALTERTDILSEMNVTKDKFFNIISHDLKNPAYTLHDNLRLLVRNVRVWDADMLSDFSNELLHAAEGQVELLNSLLNWARIQTGRITCTPVAFDLVARLRTDVALVRKLAENKGVALQCQMPDDAIVTGDANMLTTVVRNLLTNAVKFTAPAGKVTLTVSPLSPTQSPPSPLSPAQSASSPRATLALPREQSSPFPASEARLSPAQSAHTISISDTGTGMTPEQIENLFRLDKPQSRRGTAGEEGTGLGLIVCKELLGMHGAILHVESEQGKGSRFWFTL